MSRSSSLGLTISVVIPLFNESEVLPSLIAAVHGELAALDVPFEILLVDDGSSDGTWRVIEDAGAAHAEVTGIRLSRNFGKEAALAAGLEHACGEAAIVMDGDLQHPPELIPAMVARWRKGDVDIVEAVKSKRGREPWWHRFCARLFYKLIGMLSGERLHGATDFKLLDRRAVEAWRRLGERKLFFRGMSSWLGFRRETVPFNVPPRAGGRPRWPLFQLIRLAITGLTSFSSLPLHLTTLIGLCFLVFSGILGGHTLYMKFSGEAISGFTTVILLILILGSCILISLGIVGIYIARIYEEVKARPRYLIAGRCGPVREPKPSPPGSDEP